MKTILSVVVLAIGATVAGCGGDDDGGGFGASYTEEQQQEICQETCEFDAMCDEEEVDPSCMTECLQAAANLDPSQAEGFLDCAMVSCEANEDQCILDVEARPIDLEFAEACTEFYTTCWGEGEIALCDLEEPEGGALLKIYQASFIEEFMTCFDGECADFEACTEALL